MYKRQIAPLSFNKGNISSIRVEDGSAALECQKLLPNSSVVSAFNNISAQDLLKKDKKIDCDVIICGDDEIAKKTVMTLAEKISSVRAIDGGRLENQIATLKEQIKEAKRQRQSIEKQLISQLDVALESYYGSEKSYKVIFDMVELSQKNKEELSAQLQSGRSKIQDVLNAEVTLAENRILLVNALAEFTLASYRVRALTHGLTKEIGWKTF